MLLRLVLTRDPCEDMKCGGVHDFLWRHKAELIYLRLVSHQVDSEKRVVLLQSLSHELDVRSLHIVERQVQMNESFVEHKTL